MSMTPDEARRRLTDIEQDLRMPRIMYAQELGAQADLYRAVAGLHQFLKDALV